MRPFVNPKDAAFVGIPTALPRMVGRKTKPSPMRTPDERADARLPEADIHTVLERRIEASGKPYVSLREHLYGWLKAMVACGHDEAQELLDILKDMPDLLVFDKDPLNPWSRCLLLELKRRTGQGRPGQRRLAAAAGGTIAKGQIEAESALNRFLNHRNLGVTQCPEASNP